MKSSLLGLCLLLVLAVASFTPAQALAPPESGSIRGVVKLGILKAEEGQIKVTLVGSDKEPVKTDKNGEFKFTDVAPGSYTLKAEGSIQNKVRRGELTNVMPSADAKRLLTIEVK